MRTLIEVYQDQADECARLAKKTDDPKRRETLLKWAAEWTQAIQRGSHDSRGRISRGTYNGPERRRAGKMPPP